MLRLVHPAPAGNATDPPRRRHGSRAPSLTLSAEEARHLSAAARNIARTFGSLTKLARALGIGHCTLRRKPTPALAIALWRLTGTPLEELLRGRLERPQRSRSGTTRRSPRTTGRRPCRLWPRSTSNPKPTGSSA